MKIHRALIQNSDKPQSIDQLKLKTKKSVRASRAVRIH